MGDYMHNAHTAVPAPNFHGAVYPPPPPPPSYFNGPGVGGYQQPVGQHGYGGALQGGQYGNTATPLSYSQQHGAPLNWSSQAPAYPSAQQFSRPPNSNPAYSASFPSVPAFNGGTFTFPPPNSSQSHQAPSHNRGNGHNRFHDRNQRGRRDGPNQNHSQGGRGNFNQNRKRGRDQRLSVSDDRVFKRAHVDTTTQPSFVPASLPPKPPKSSLNGTSPSGLANKAKKKKQPHRNILGLTPKAEDAPSSEDEADEEATLANAYDAEAGPSGPTINLKSAEEVQKWIAERKKRYPTRANIAAKMTLQNMAEAAHAKRNAQSAAPAQLVANYDSSDAEDDEQAPEEVSSKVEVPSLQEQTHLATPAASRSPSTTDAQPIGNAAKSSEPGRGAASGKEQLPPSKVYCKTWANLGFCTWKKCKFLHSLPGNDSAKANEEHAQKQQSKHRRNLYQEVSAFDIRMFKGNWLTVI